MDKRLKFGFIAFVGLALLVAGVLIFISPYLSERRAAQPPELPREISPVGPTQPSVSGEVPKPNQLLQPVQIPLPAAAKIRILENRSRIVVERMGSGVSRDGFSGSLDIREEFTDAGRVALLAERVRIQKLYPASGPVTLLSTDAISAAAGGGSGEETIRMTVQAIQSIESRGVANNTGKRILITFRKQSDGLYLIDAIQWEDMVL